MKTATTKKPREKTQTELAADYGVTERTIRAWERDGAPLPDPKQMVRWIRDRRTGGGSTPLPDGLEHANILRHLVEHAAAHFLPDALEHVANPLLEVLVEEDGFTPHKARGMVIMLYLMLRKALSDWTSENRFDLHLKQEDGTDLDGLLRRLLPEYRDRSLPSDQGFVFPVGPVVRLCFEQNGGAETLASLGVPPTPAKQRRREKAQR